MIKLVILDNYLSDLFTEVKVWYWKPLKFGQGRDIRRKRNFNQERLFLQFGALNKDIKCKRKFSDNLGHNVLTLFDVLASFWFTTSETNCD